MDEPAADLIQVLLTRVGMLMEDASPVALTLCARDPAFVEQLDALARAIDSAGVLLRAAAVVFAGASKSSDAT